MKLVTSTVALVVPHRQFNETEYSVTRAALEREGCRIKIVAASLQEAVGAKGMRVKPQMLFSDVQPAQFDGIVFIGGGGARDFWNHPRAHNAVRAFESHGKVLGAICIAPVIIANTGILKDRNGTCHVSARREFEAAGVNYTAEPVVTCCRIVTASGPDAAPEFAAALIALLSNETPSES